MADATQELNIKLKGTLDVDTASAKSAGEKAGKAVKDGMETVISKSKIDLPEIDWKKVESDKRKAVDAAMKPIYKERYKMLYAEIQKQNEAYKNQLDKARYGSVFGEIKEPKQSGWG